MKLLRIDSSARRSSVSRRLTARASSNPGKSKIPLGRSNRARPRHHPVPADHRRVDARPPHSDPSKRTAAQQEVLAVSDMLVEELLAADTIVIGAPMHNFTVSALAEGVDRPDRPRRPHRSRLDRTRVPKAC
jgi:FMN-dependent NADH-azoreductase